MPSIDLDAMRRARWAERGETMTLTVSGESFTLPAELSLEVGEALQAMGTDMTPVVKLLLPEEDYPRFAALTPRPTNEDVIDILSMYSSQLGEYAASRFSSRDTGEQSRPISSSTTASTYVQPPLDEGAGVFPPAS